MLRLTVEGEKEQVDELWEKMKDDLELRVWDHAEMIKPNSNEKNMVCYIQVKAKQPSISRVGITTDKGEVISFDLSNCHHLELEEGKQIVIGYHYDIFGG
jgi:hypothetical protein